MFVSGDEGGVCVFGGLEVCMRIEGVDVQERWNGCDGRLVGGSVAFSRGILRDLEEEFWPLM